MMATKSLWPFTDSVSRDPFLSSWRVPTEDVYVKEPRNTADLPFRTLHAVFGLASDTQGNGVLYEPKNDRFCEGVTEVKVPGVEEAVEICSRYLLKVHYCRWRCFGMFLHNSEAITFIISDRCKVESWELRHHCFDLINICCILGRPRRRDIVRNIKKAIGVVLE